MNESTPVDPKQPTPDGSQPQPPYTSNALVPFEPPLVAPATLSGSSIVDVSATEVTGDTYHFRNIPAKLQPLDLIELSIWPPRQGERGSTFPIWVDLNIDSQTIITESWRIVVKIQCAELSAVFRGCSAAQGTRFGQYKLNNSITSTATSLHERDFSAGAEGAAELSASTKGFSGGVEAKAAVKAQIRAKEAIETKSEIVRRRVRALPNDRWAIEENGSSPLKGFYLVAPAKDESGEPLCEVVAHSPNLFTSLCLEVRPPDLLFDVTPRQQNRWWPTSERPNQEAVAKLLVIKANSACHGREGDERVTLAEAILEGNLIARESR